MDSPEDLRRMSRRVYGGEHDGEPRELTRSSAQRGVYQLVDSGRVPPSRRGHAVTSRRLVLVGLLLGAVAAVVFHVTTTSTQPTGWFAYAPLQDEITITKHPSWWPTAVVAPLIGALLGAGLGSLGAIRRR